jgi:hypothetical protein
MESRYIRIVLVILDFHADRLKDRNVIDVRDRVNDVVI